MAGVAGVVAPALKWLLVRQPDAVRRTISPAITLYVEYTEGGRTSVLKMATFVVGSYEELDQRVKAFQKENFFSS